jgi:hypothetical protein
LAASERPGELACHVGHAGLEPGHRLGVGEHGGDHVPAIAHDLDQAGVGERIHERIGAVHQIGAGVPVPDDVTVGHAAACPVHPARLAAGRGAGQAGVRGHLPGLRERITEHGGRCFTAAPLDRWAPRECVDHAQHAALAHREVESCRPFQGTCQQIRSRMRGADDEDRLTDLAAVNDQDVRAGCHD